MKNFLIYNNLAGKCLNPPNLLTGEATSNWNGSLLTGTIFHYSCPTGKFFKNTYSGQLENKCYSPDQNTPPDWLYGATTPLPSCVGMYSTCKHKHVQGNIQLMFIFRYLHIAYLRLFPHNYYNN